MIFAKLKYILKRIFQYFFVFFSYLKIYFKNKKDDKNIIFDINENIGRYYYLILKFFELGGFNIIIPMKYSILFNNYIYNKKIFQLNNLRIAKKSDYEKYVIISDSKDKYKKFVFLDYNVFNSNKIEKQIPYPRHPLMYENDLEKKLEKFRNNSKKIRIFFSGGGKENEYNNSIITDFFKILNRYEILDNIKNRLTKEELIVVEKQNEFYLLLENENKKIVIVEPDSFRFGAENWLETLSFSDFFLSPPGIIMPMCHNIIEAISVGVIPLTQYPHLFNPPLENNINCIHFENEEDLISKIRYILALDKNTITIMKNNVIEYYNSFLSPTAFCHKLNQNIYSIDKLFYNVEEISVKLIKN